MNIDETSEILLSTLREVGEPLGTGTLREETEFSQNKPILDRLRRLKELEFIELSHTEELPGAAADRQYWTISEKGREWVDANRDEITKTTARQVETSLQNTLERVDRIDEEMRTLNSKIDGWQETMNRRSKRLSRLDSKVDKETGEAVRLSDEAWNKAQELETRTDEIEADVQELHDEIEKTNERLNELEDAIESEREARESAVNQLSDWTSQQLQELQKTAEKARHDAKKARNRGIVDILTGR